jgi:hypothetical protein
LAWAPYQWYWRRLHYFLLDDKGTGDFIERWIVRLIEWFLAPSRANRDERR